MKTITDEKLESIIRRRIDQCELALERSDDEIDRQNIYGQRTALLGILWFFEDHAAPLDKINNAS